MALVTVTAVQTISGPVETLESLTTSTLSIQTIVLATPGDTITLGPANSYATPSLLYTPSFVATQTYTVTEYDVYLAGPQGNIWSTLVVDIPNSPYPPGDKFFVVPEPCSGWRCWSAGQKAGLVVGAVFGVVLLLLLFCCLRTWHKRKFWISHGAHGANDYERWQHSHPGWGYYGPPQANLHTGLGLRPYVTPAQAEAALRGGASGPAAAPAGGEAKKNEEAKKVPEKKGARQKLGAWIAG